MPSTTFTRPGDVDQALISVSTPQVPSGFMMRSHSGVINTRSAMEVGRVWREQYGLLNMNRPDTHQFLSWLRWAWNQHKTFQIQHEGVPGSGMPPRGNPSGTPSVNGAGQTGDTIATTGWTASTTDLLLPGDYIKFNNIPLLYEVLDSVSSDGSGNANITVNPPLYEGNSPSGAITYEDNYFTAQLRTAPEWPDTENSFWFSGMILVFQEKPNA